MVIYVYLCLCLCTVCCVDYAAEWFAIKTDSKGVYAVVPLWSIQ